MNESLIKHAFFKPCFDAHPMAFPSEVSYSPAAPYHPFPWPSSTQLLHILLHRCLHQNNPSTMQYNWLESETQCASMHSSPLPSPPWTQPSSHHHLCYLHHLFHHLCYLHLGKRKYCIKHFFMYFSFNADLSKFDSQYYDIRYIHSLLLNSGPWTETINTQL